MDKDFIVFLLIGIVAVAMAILGKFRPDIIFRNAKGKTLSVENQRFMFIILLLYGIMFILVGLATCLPQFADYKAPITISIVVLMTVLMLFGLWKIKYSQNERFGRVLFAAFLLISIALIALSVYYWYITLK